MSSVQQGSSVEFAVTREELEGGVVALAVAGELDVATVPALREQLNAAIDSGVTRLVVDLADVRFIDSVSLAALVNAQRRLNEGRYALVVPSESYGRLIFQAGGIEAVLPLFESRDEAVEHARS